MRTAWLVATSAASLSGTPNSGTRSFADWASALLCLSSTCSLAPPANCGRQAGHMVAPRTLHL
eukprot:13715078-Alexandrium_andersonii.AAC.1